MRPIHPLALNSTGLISWIQDNVIQLVVLVAVAIPILTLARKNNMAKALGIVAIAILGLSLVFGWRAWANFAQDLTNLAFK